MDLKKITKKEEAAIEGTPPWAVELFEKMRKEMCAEIHAKVAYSMKVMLDNLKREILSQFDDPGTTPGCYCKELKKCKACIQKKHALKADCQLQKKEEKKLLKLSKRKSFSDSNSDNELQPVVRAKNKSTAMSESKLVGKDQNASACIASMMENLNLTTQGSDIHNSGAKDEAKIVNCTTKAKHGTAGSFNCPEHDTMAKENIKDNVSVKDAEVRGAEAASFSQSSPSDSEFEVVSLPANANNSLLYAAGMGETSDFDDTSASGQCTDTETETEFKDCKQSISEVATAIPANAQLDDYAKTIMMSSTSSGVSGASYATVRDSGLSGAGACEMEIPIVIPERERAPYSVPCEGVERINRGDIINNQPLPSEFLRERKSLSQNQAETEPQATSKQPQAQPVEQTRAPPMPTPRTNSSYRVDNLPESLWDEALTVAAQTYNAARTAVGTLADTFVPGIPPVDPRTGIQMPGPPVNTTGRPIILTHLSEPERKLYDMGFKNTIQNSQLLQRYNNDIPRVLQDLLGS